ncbi:MAG: hypothetical protein RDV48_25550 [Candidatus Eremiobacteraeota bacterium]|nr:hypothetical protein [Candidatus Eremiobacteraeota bacterium]
MVLNEFKAKVERKYHCCYIGRKHSKSYLSSHDQIMEKWGSLIVKKGEMPGIFAQVMNDYYYMIRADNLDTVREVIDYVHRLA